MARNSELDVLHVLDSLAPDGTQNSYLAMLPGFCAAGLRVGVLGLCQREDSLGDAFRDAGARVWEWEKDDLVLQTARLQRFLYRMRPGVVHSALFRADLASRFATVGTDVPLISTLANISYGPAQREHFPGHPLKLRMAHLVDASTARMTQRYHAVAEHVASAMARTLWVPRDRITVVPRGRRQDKLGRRTAERRAAVRERMGVENDRTVVLVVGRHEVQKAPRVNLESFARVHQAFPDAVLWIAGHSGAETDALKARITELGLDDVVRILGPRPDVPDLMVAADVLSFPSRWEGMPGTLIEAMAMELPIVASDIPSVREVLTEACGFLVPVDDPVTLSETVIRVLSDAEERERVVRAARDRFESRFTIEAAVDGMIDLYRTVARG